MPRLKINDRGSIVALVGAGRAALDLDALCDATRAYGCEPGLRCLATRKRGLRVGVDIGRGPEETVGFLTLGSTW